MVGQLDDMMNPADGWSGRRNYDISYVNMTAMLRSTVAPTTITESYGDLLQVIKAAQEINFLATKIWPNLFNDSITDDSQRKSIDRVLIYNRTLSVLTALCSRVIRDFHNNIASGHFGVLKTVEPRWREYCWPGMVLEIWAYVASCQLCHRINALHHTCNGLNMPLSLSSCPCEALTIEYVTNLPESIALEYTRIQVFFNCLTKMATYLPSGKGIDCPALSCMFFEHVSWKGGIPDNITSNRTKDFTNPFWYIVCSHHVIN